jgi:predicted O-methyltransferase YrrM
MLNEPKGVELVRELARSFWYSAVLRAGIKLDAFSLLDARSLTTDELAQEMRGEAGFVIAFVEACEALGLVERQGSRFSNSAAASEFLVAGKEGYVGDHALHHTNAWESWGRLDEIVRQGKTIPPFETDFVDAETYWTNYMMGQHNRAMTGQARHLVDGVDLNGMRSLVDLGGGAASYSIALCQANPDLRSVVVDRPEPLVIARKLVAENNLTSRISFIESDFFDADLDDGYDVVLVSGVVLIKSDDECRRLFELALRLLSPGGMIIVQDYLRIDRTPDQARVDAMENLYVKVVFDAGAADRDGAEVAEWLLDAGFQHPQLIPAPTQLALVTAKKPS